MAAPEAKKNHHSASPLLSARGHSALVDSAACWSSSPTDMARDRETRPATTRGRGALVARGTVEVTAATAKRDVPDGARHLTGNVKTRMRSSCGRRRH
jgi:hypothetical protein